MCNKEFEKIMAFTGHKAWHVKRSGKDVESMRERNRVKKEKNTANYYLNPYTCKTCTKIIPYEKASTKRSELKNGAKYTFCSSSCAAKFNNSNRIMSEKTKKKISNTLLEKYNSLKDSAKYNLLKDSAIKIEIICTVCASVFSCKKSKIRKTCSKLCKDFASSLYRQQYLKENGNFSTPREFFTYKDTNIEVDSNLEKAGIIYLTNILNANTIHRFNNIIYYKMNNKNKTYNPDFICRINEQTYIVEVKQKWISTSNHIYNASIPYKKVALEKYCAEKGYKHLWLDFDTAPELKAIYRKILKDRKSSSARG